MSKTAKKKKGSASKQALPLCVLYGLDIGTKRGDAVRAVLAEHGVRAKTVAADDLGNPVGAVVGATGFRATHLPYAGEAPQTEFMLLHNVPGKLMDQLLAAMREAGASVDHKAMVTPTNRLWPLGRLIEQVMAEHAALHGETQ